MGEYTYRQARPQSSDLVDHASHNYEWWQRYLACGDDPALDEIPGDASGLCCHDCRVIVWEV